MPLISEKTEIQLGISGAFLVFLFLFLPVAPVVSGGVGPESATNVLLYGKGEQYAIILLSILAAFFIYQRAQWALLGGVLAISGIMVSALFLFWRSMHFFEYWLGYAVPGFLHWAVLLLGITLLGASFCFRWMNVDGQRGAVKVQLGASPTKPKVSTHKPSKSSSFRRPSFGDVVGSIDWSWWGIMLLSFVVWPLGVLLHFAYSRSSDDKADAAIIGAGLGLGLMVLRFVLAMGNVGSAG